MTEKKLDRTVLREKLRTLYYPQQTGTIATDSNYDAKIEESIGYILSLLDEEASQRAEANGRRKH